LKKQLNLPALFVNGGDGDSGQLEVIGQLVPTPAACPPTRCHQTQILQVRPACHKGLQADDFIAAYRAALGQGSGLDPHDIGVGLEPGNEKTPRLVVHRVKRW